MSDLLTNPLFVDNISEALYQVIGEGCDSFTMLICEVIKDGVKYQVQLKVVSNKDFDFIDNDEDMPVFEVDDEYRICKLATP